MGSFLILKLNFINEKIHTYLTHNYVEVLSDKNINLKKNVNSKIDDWVIYTDKNRLRVNSQNFNHNLKENVSKIIFIGDSVTFGYGVDYNESIPGIIQNLNSSLLSVNAAVPSYSIVQSVEKFEKEFKYVKNIKYVFLKIYNPTDMYLMFGKKWSKELNWFNHLNFLNKDKFIYKYTNLPIWGEINFFKILRKIHIMYFFKTSEYNDNKRDRSSDLRFTNHIKDELNKLTSLLNNDTILILTPVVSPYIINENLKSEKITDIEKSRIEIINLFNSQLLSFKKQNVIFFDTIKILKQNNKKDLFIDECCHLSQLGSEIISQNLHIMLKNFD